ncbi:MAG: GntR family transcriptional regulator [Thermodesulfobacteriota bacterium]
MPSHRPPRPAGPKYRLMAQELRTEIESGAYPDGAAFPSETNLIEYYGVSRMTVRAALAILEAEGLLDRRRGSGTYVRHRTVHKVLGKLVDFHREATLMNRRARSSVLALTRRPGVLRESLLFHLKPGEEVWELKRLRFLDDTPVVLQTSSHPLRVLEGVTQADLTDRSLYQFLHLSKGLTVVRAEEVIEPQAVAEPEAGLLRLIPGSAVFLARRSAFDQAGRAVELSYNLIRGDHYKFTFSLKPEEEA